MKKFVLISLFLMISSLAYSHSLGIGMYIPLGGSIPSFYPESSVDPSVSFSPKTAFEVGVIFQPRINFNIGDGTHTISLGLDVGWYRDTFKFITADSRNYTHEFDSVMTGLNLEWRPLLFQLGIGGGVKIPFSGKYTEGDTDRKISGLSGRFNDVLIPYVRLYTGINIVFKPVVPVGGKAYDVFAGVGKGRLVGVKRVGIARHETALRAFRHV